MKKSIQSIFLVIIIALVLSIYVGASDLQLQNDILIEISSIGLNKDIDFFELLNIMVNAQAYIDKDILNRVEFHFIDVGQGDSALIILPNGKTMLIDAGVSDYGSKVVDYLKKLNISKIDYLVMTHPHVDHIGGMGKVIDNFDIGIVYMTDTISTSKTYENLLLKIEKKNLEITTLESNDIISEFDEFKAVILSPSKESDEINDMSLVMKITYKNNTFILMGDAETNEENDILNSFSNIKADLIKIGHHGSITSSSAKFIEKVAPIIAIISCGRYNPYGHPNIQTLETLKKYGVKVYRTDELGDIIAISDGNVINITYQNYSVL